MTTTRRRAGLGCLAVLAALAAAAPAEATFPGRNGAIAFGHSASSGEPEPVDTRGLAVVAPGATEERVLIECELTGGEPSGGDCAVASFTDPSYSADGRLIVFDAGERLAIVNADGSGLRLLPATTADDGDPAFAPGGRRIVFTGENDRGSTDVYVRRLGGGPARVVAHDASEPAWSSRNTLAYVRELNIYRVPAAGGRRRLVTAGVSPDWSPDGRRLLLIRPKPNVPVPGLTGRIYVVGARGGGLRRISSGNSLSNPVWSPDSRWFAYDGFDLGIHKRRLAGGRARVVSASQIGSEGAFVASFDPTWRPR